MIIALTGPAGNVCADRTAVLSTLASVGTYPERRT